MHEPIFEFFRDPNSSDRYDILKIFVNWNGKRTPLIDALKIIEAPFVEDGFPPGDYNWRFATDFFQDFVIDFPERKNLRVLSTGSFTQKNMSRYRPFGVYVEETEDSLIWSRDEYPSSDKIPFGFKTHPSYPKFVFDKKRFFEELEAVRPEYEERERLEKEWNEKRKQAHLLDQEWDLSTFGIDDIDLSEARKSCNDGPIFETYFDEYAETELVRIFVRWNGRNYPLVNLLKIWEASFVDPGQEPGQYDWLSAKQLQKELTDETGRIRPFRRVLDCTCHCEGCWPFFIEQFEKDDLIVWKNFRQPFRNKYSLAGFWDYSIYPPLVFDKKRFFEELYNRLVR